MKPRTFNYHRPDSLEEALGLLAQHADEAKVLAGGQSLLPMLNFRLASPAHLLDINRIAALGGLAYDNDALAIGAIVRQRAVENTPDVALSYPLLRSALTQVAHLQIRNRGTVCGSLAHADASAELPAVMVTLGASMVALSARAKREIPAEEFFEFHLGTALAADELLAEVRLPPPPAGSYGTFVEVARRAGDFALVGAAVQATISDDGVVRALRIACTGVAPTPLLVPDAAAVALGSNLSDSVLLEVDQAVRRVLDPPGDVHASASYRKVVAGTIVRRALAALRDEAAASHG